jgi:hypothetical protein
MQSQSKEKQPATFISQLEKKQGHHPNTPPLWETSKAQRPSAALSLGNQTP